MNSVFWSVVVIIEDVFRIQSWLTGIGWNQSRLPRITCGIDGITLIVLVVNFLADLSAQLIDPRRSKMYELIYGAY